MENTSNTSTPKVLSFAKNKALGNFYHLFETDFDSEEMTDFQFSNGNRIALPYGYLVSSVLNNNSLIEARYNNWEIIIKGRNMEPIYKALVNRKLKFVRRANENEMDDDTLDSFVTEMIVRDLISPENKESGIKHNIDSNSNEIVLKINLSEIAKHQSPSPSVSNS